MFFGTNLDEEKYLSYMSHHDYDTRMVILLYLVRNETNADVVFPINTLRNIGIRNSRTTHYIVFDLDVWPASNPMNLV